MRRLTVCARHNTIMDLAQEILELEDGPNKMRSIRSRAKRIIKEAEQALDAGQAMEDRLNKYQGAIIELGFRRTR